MDLNKVLHPLDGFKAAYDCGFQSVDGFTRAFHREFGCNPGDYAKDPVPIRLFIP